MSEDSPIVLVVAGPNGAGKSTASRTLLADRLAMRTFVNADVIAQGLAGFDPASAALEASRIMLERLKALAERRENFAFETTLAGRTHCSWLKTLIQVGYKVHLVYIWLVSPDLAVARVAVRVNQGGHDIPESTIRQRYRRSLSNLFALYLPVVTTWEVYDNSQENSYRLIASSEATGTVSVFEPNLWEVVQGR